MDSVLRQRILKQVGDRLNIRAKKLNNSHWSYVKVLILFIILQLIGVTFFLKGFLLSRTVLDNTSTCVNENCFKPSHFNKAVLIVIDALRFDFVIPNEGSKEMYHNQLPVLYDLTQSHKENSLLLKFIADPPTTTLQRLKGLTTGSLPTFIDAGSNFNGDVIDEDNWISQLYYNNKSVAFIGDDTWTALFNPFFNQKLSFPYDSLNVWDLHTVDNGVIEHIFPLLENNNKKDWDVMIAHLLGVDHAGHRYGPKHFSMAAKLKQMNEFISNVISEIDNETLLLVMGDHGMDQTGNHGGESKDEVEAALFMYSKKPFFGRLEDSYYNISNAGKYHRSVNQIDLVPTLSLLLGLPIPYNNLGIPIQECFNNNIENLARANFETVTQIQNYRNSSSILAGDEEINNKYQELFEIYKKNSYDKTDFNVAALNYQALSLDRCKNLWARFDLLSISIGVSLLFVSLCLMLTYSKIIPSIVICQLNDQFFNVGVFSMFLGITITNSIFFVLRPETLNFAWSSLLGVGFGIIIGILVPLMDRYSIPWLLAQIRENVLDGGWSYLSFAFLLIHCLIFASNSFVIWEDKIVSFLLSTFGFISLIRNLQKKYSANDTSSNLSKILGIYHSLMFIILQRLSSTITLCREEQHPYCRSNFEITWWSVLLLYITSYLLPECLKAFYNITSSYQTAAQMWISKGLKYSMVCVAVYWTLELIEHDDKFSSLSFINLEVLKSIKLTISRTILGISLIAANISWSFGPICIKLEINDNNNSKEKSAVSNKGKEAYIVGYGNVYGSSYFLLIVNFLVAVLMATKPLGELSLFLLVNQILSLLELADILQLKNHSIITVVLSLLAYSNFFSTGHQATLQSIQWEIGFLATETIMFPFNQIPIILNTFGGFIICSLTAGLLSVYKRSPSSKPITLISKIAENLIFFIMINLFLAFGSTLMTTFFRRHLMVWKIFAPRCFFSCMVLIVINAITIITIVSTGFVVKKFFYITN
ncbi:hypothetical protein PACTADRAFT_38885 [Pachysolen tannophilus NRRL Y-2460]|uniref:GPI ethanolamine phosphate transferase 3, catalytic subunit n=1 Tax=Pachysolen tannophilus NRRL Y-2460 TaxID=669874 RepID=A0A1E4U039_PACTA|nr:hypothetical protein PACTADRAFT_38885 [Pachysolen tannophilus NRRL Y-2460]